jgi:hypothetical protein
MTIEETVALGTEEEGAKGTKATGVLPEHILREEIRALRDLNFKLIQWSIAVLTAVIWILFYSRRAFRDDLVAAKLMTPGQQLPAEFGHAGTFFLLALASIFALATYSAQRRNENFRDQLKAIEAAPVKERIKPLSRWPMILMYFFFPLFDWVAQARLHTLLPAKMFATLPFVMSP